MSNRFNLRTITTPLLITLLKEEMRFPIIFILRCRLTFGQFKKRIGRRFPKEFVDLASLPAWIYLNLKKKIKPDQALEIMRIALLSGGVAQQSLLFDPVHTRRTFENLIEKELEMNRIGTTRWNTLKIVERNDHKFQISIVRCLFYEFALSLGIPELVPVICSIDNAVFNSYLPDKVVFQRGGTNRRIADGASECTFIWDKVS